MNSCYSHRWLFLLQHFYGRIAGKTTGLIRCIFVSLKPVKKVRLTNVSGETKATYVYNIIFHFNIPTLYYSINNNVAVVTA